MDRLQRQRERVDCHSNGGLLDFEQDGRPAGDAGTVAWAKALPSAGRKRTLAWRRLWRQGAGLGVTSIFVAAALAGTLVWSALDRRRRQYQTLLAWLRFLLRLSIGIAMLLYGFAKLFPEQMQPPSLAVLNEPVGQISPMTLLWTMIGSSPGYEMVCGFAEVAGGLLLLYRRTALFGALPSAAPSRQSLERR